MRKLLGFIAAVLFIPLIPVGYVARVAWLALSIGWEAAKVEEDAP